MRNGTVRVAWLVWAVLMLVLATGTGCSTPASVDAILEQSAGVKEREAERLIDEIERDAQWIEQARQRLEDAYERDLAEQGTLDPQWVRDATDVYVLAREQLVRYQMELERERHTRAANLRDAAEATERARRMLADRDRLWTRLEHVVQGAEPEPATDEHR